MRPDLDCALQRPRDHRLRARHAEADEDDEDRDAADAQAVRLLMI